MVERLNLNATYEELLEQKFERLPEQDKRETSMIYQATAVNTYETIQMLQTLLHSMNLLYADTAPRDYLIKRAAERGMAPYPSTPAKVRGLFNIDIPIGSRYNLDTLNYIATQRLAAGEFLLECETNGSVGNNLLGSLIPIDYIDGLETAEITEVLVFGEDEEDTELFRKRYLDDFETIAFGGNRKDYKEKVGEIDGVGGVRVYRTPNGASTVKLVIINSEYKKPTPSFVASVQRIVDPIPGEGEGLAPIDHIVTVFSVDESTIDIHTNISYMSSYDWSYVQSGVEAAIDSYFLELAEEWATSDSDFNGVVIRISQIETRLLQIDGILDITNTQLNGSLTNIQLDATSVPKRGVVNAQG